MQNMPRDLNYFQEVFAKCMDPTHHFTQAEARTAMHRLVKDEPDGDEIIRKALLYANKVPHVVMCPNFDNLHDCMHRLLQTWHSSGIISIATPDGELLMIDTLKKKRNMRRYIELFCDREDMLEKKHAHKLKISTYLLLMNDEANCVGHDKRMQLISEFGLGHSTNGISTYDVQVPRQMSRISLRICSYCLASSNGGGLLKCGKCKTTYYCNPHCQKQAWSGHKHYCTLPKTKFGFLVKKIHLAWQACLLTHKQEILQWLDHINQVYKQKSRAILLAGVEPGEDGFLSLQFVSVSLRFFTSYANQNKHYILRARAILEHKQDAFLLSIPFNGYFLFSFI